MKANEAPEKIYVEITHPISDEYTEIIAFEDGNGIEYTRTDAFIEKACEWLELNLSDRSKEDIKFWLEDFKNYMKGNNMKKEIRNINGTLYYVYPLNWVCLSTDNNFPCKDCECYGGREGNKILCTEDWIDKPNPNDNYSL